MKTDPRSIDTLEVPLPAVSMLKSHDFAAEKCGCFRGPKTAVHFAEKYQTSIAGDGVPVQNGVRNGVNKANGSNGSKITLQKYENILQLQHEVL